MQRIATAALGALILASIPLAGRAPRPAYRAELLFPVEHWHNHSPSIVQHPDGHLLVTWFHGSGERTADDVEIRGAWQKAGTATWSAPALLADTPGYPDTNPTLFVDRKATLWLLWPTILANEWPTALMKVKTASRWPVGAVPSWDRSEVMHITPPDRFAEVTSREADRLAASLPAGEAGDRTRKYLEKRKADAADKLTRRLGWMTRVHPIQLEDGRIIVPLYSDGFSFSLMAYTDDRGAHWKFSTPLVGAGNIQPAIARTRSGELVAYMRDNGPAPKRLHVSRSSDDGATWSTVVDSDLPNPGSAADIVTLRNGNWVVIYNDVESGRNSLAVALSEDEGKSWPWKRQIELDPAAQPKTAHYPAIIQGRDGMLHASYSYFFPTVAGAADRKTIRHAAFDEAWIRAGR